MSRLIAIGDIHGCSAALDALITALELSADDRVVTLGDYVDRGPDSRGVVDRLLELDAAGQLIPLLGNHEEMMLSALRGRAPRLWWLRHGGAATLESYGFVDDASCIPQEHLDFFDRCLPFHEVEDVFFTHANYVAGEPLERQPVEALRWQSLDEHFPGPHRSGKRAIVGHTAQRSGEVRDEGHLICIDTYCHGGGWLTAYDVGSGATCQATRDGAVRRQSGPTG